MDIISLAQERKIYSEPAAAHSHSPPQSDDARLIRKFMAQNPQFACHVKLLRDAAVVLRKLPADCTRIVVDSKPSRKRAHSFLEEAMDASPTTENSTTGGRSKRVRKRKNFGKDFIRTDYVDWREPTEKKAKRIKSGRKSSEYCSDDYSGKEEKNVNKMRRASMCGSFTNDVPISDREISENIRYLTPKKKCVNSKSNFPKTQGNFPKAQSNFPKAQSNSLKALSHKVSNGQHIKVVQSVSPPETLRLIKRKSQTYEKNIVYASRNSSSKLAAQQSTPSSKTCHVWVKTPSSKTCHAGVKTPSPTVIQHESYFPQMSQNQWESATSNDTVILNSDGEILMEPLLRTSMVV